MAREDAPNEGRSKEAPTKVVRVGEGLRSDAGLGVAHLDPDTQMALQLFEGEALEIHGKRRTVAKLAKPLDGAATVRMDGLVRRNANVGIGDEVRVRKATVVPAQRAAVSLVITEGYRIELGPKVHLSVKEHLRDRYLTKGDIVIVPGVGLLGAALPFLVQLVEPEGIAQVFEGTAVEVGDDPVLEDGSAWTSAGAEFAGLRERLDQAERDALYLRAEVENVRKASDREKAEFSRHAAQEVFERMLPALDELETARRALPEEHAKGVGMVRDNLLRALGEIGLQSIPAAEGARFDPYWHEVADVVIDSPLEEGRIAAVLRTGYSYNLKVLRPTLVAVVKKGGSHA